MNTSSPLLFAIKRYALHDGPNIRTTVFFKGCPLRCFWCHNPESIAAHSEIVLNRDKCIGCRECLHACPQEALEVNRNGLQRNKERCTTCFECVEICPAIAQEGVGYHSSPDEVMLEIEKDLPFYDQSGGGVTFSGGEPLMQPEPLLELLKLCGRRNIHRAVDTTGFAKTRILLEIAEHTELFLFDLKHMNSEFHQRYTGVPNELILHNLRQLSGSQVSIRIRIPLLAAINDDEENVRATAVFVAGLANVQGIDLLPYHHFASSKYAKLGGTYRAQIEHVPKKETITRVKNILEEYGHQVRIGG